MISLDCETTGLDFQHGARPFLVTTCDDDNESQQFWEWDVDPLTREVQPPLQDIEDIIDIVSLPKYYGEPDGLVLQNPKFDVQALASLDKDFGRLWRWKNTWDTLLAGHLLASNQPHDLTTMVLVYLGVNIAPYEDAIKQATKEARRMCQAKDSPYHDWAIAKAGRKDMPSAKKGEKLWKMDIWLPRAIAKAEGYPIGECKVVNRRKEKFDVSICRGSIWGNPFKIPRDGNRKEVIEKYRRYLASNLNLHKKLRELEGCILGCFCKPLACHGDVLVEEVAKLAHPWWTVCSEYANSDSASTLALFKKQRKFLEQRGHWKIYLEKLKVLPIIYEMEERGITLNGKRLEESLEQYKEESKQAGDLCVGLAKSIGCELELPKSGNNNSLLSFVFGEQGLNLEPTKVSQKTGNPSLSSDVLDIYASTLPKRSRGLVFVRALRGKRKRDTAISYMEGYKRFGLPLDWEDKPKYYRLHPSLNITGTATTRLSSKNPNEQNISAQEGFNLRRAFGPSPGREWYSIDYNNLELRIPAYVSNERKMIEIFENPEKPPYYGSYHLLICHLIHRQKFEKCVAEGVSFKDKHNSWYKKTKNFNFAVQYGAMEQSGTADRAAGVPGAQAKVNNLLQEKNRLNDKWIKHAEKYGYVETIPDTAVDADHGYPLLCGRTSWGKISPTIPLSYYVQGTAGWVMMRAMIEVQKYLDALPDHFMILNVHDEIVFDFPVLSQKINQKKVRKIRGIMESVGKGIGIPLTCEITFHPENWAEGTLVV